MATVPKQIKDTPLHRALERINRMVRDEITALSIGDRPLAILNLRHALDQLEQPKEDGFQVAMRDFLEHIADCNRCALAKGSGYCAKGAGFVLKLRDAYARELGNAAPPAEAATTQE